MIKFYTINHTDLTQIKIFIFMMVGRHNGVRLPSGMKMQILRVMTEECENFQKLKIQYGK